MRLPARLYEKDPDAKRLGPSSRSIATSLLSREDVILGVISAADALVDVLQALRFAIWSEDLSGEEAKEDRLRDHELLLLVLPGHDAVLSIDGLAPSAGCGDCLGAGLVVRSLLSG